MNWRIVQASAIGTSHAEEAGECQDRCLAEEYRDPIGEAFFIGLVADGAGSAVRGGDGASIACTTAKDLVIQFLATGASLTDLSPKAVRAWLDATRLRIDEAAESYALTTRDFASTLLGAIIGAEHAVFFQIGDGAIVIGTQDGMRHVFWPDVGEYVNTTHFITDEDFFSHLRVEYIQAAVLEVAIFSDGLQRLALDFGLQQAYRPFFEPMFMRLRNAAFAECELLSEQLHEFLQSAKINERTDDDKTLILASRNDEEKKSRQ